MTTSALSVPFRFSGRNAAAERAAAAHAARLVTQVTEEQRQALRALIVRAIAEGIAPREAARTIRGLVGMTAPQAAAAATYRAGLVASGLKPARVDALMTTYTRKKIAQRALVIARTETMFALNLGARESWLQARDEGMLGADTRLEWIATPDERTCPSCFPMDGKQVLLGGTFDTPDGPSEGPPLHVQCRCTLAALPGDLPAADALQSEVDERDQPPEVEPADLPEEPYNEEPEPADGVVSQLVSDQELLLTFDDPELAGVEIRVASPSDSVSLADLFADASAALGVDAEALVRGMARAVAPVRVGRAAVPGVMTVDRFGGKLIVSYRDDEGGQGNRVLITRDFFRRTESGPVVAHHAYFGLPEKLQGGGRATRLLRESVEAYDRLGISRIELNANIDVGGYAWGKLGFTAADPANFRAGLDLRLADAVRENRLPRARAAELREIALRAGANGPRAVADAIADNDDEKSVLLGLSWDAIMDLRGPHAAEFRRRIAPRR